MAANIFKRRPTVAASDLKKLSETEAAQAQSSFNIEKITEIQNCFTRGEILLVPGRIFIREGILWKVCRRGPKKRQFFLFNDVLIYGSIISRGYYSNQHVLPISSMTVSSKCHYKPQVDLETSNEHNTNEELDPENAFQINHADKSFHVFALTKADKVNWIANLTKQINKLNKGEEGPAAVYKAVWVPDSVSKQCMICSQKFSAFVRKHHCRMCGRLVCSQCSPFKGDISQLSGGSPSGKVERICKECNKPVFKPGDTITSSGGSGTPIEIKVSSRPNSRQQEHHEEEVDGDSTETEDSDDSENEDKEPPIPPPRKKKLQKESETTSPATKSKPPPRPAPPKHSPSFKKVPPGRPTSPPGRPTSPPQKSLDKKLEQVNITQEKDDHTQKTEDHAHEEPSSIGKEEQRPKPVPRQQIKKEEDPVINQGEPKPLPRGEPKNEEPSPRPTVAKRTKFHFSSSSQTPSSTESSSQNKTHPSLETPPIVETPPSESTSIEGEKEREQEKEEEKEREEKKEEERKEEKVEEKEEKKEEKNAESNGEPVMNKEPHQVVLDRPSSGGRSPSMNARPRRSKFAVSATVSNS